jgi:hypothetical protein
VRLALYASEANFAPSKIAAADFASGLAGARLSPAAAHAQSSPHPKKSHVVRSGEAAAGEDTRAPRPRNGTRKELM